LVWRLCCLLEIAPESDFLEPHFDTIFYHQLVDKFSSKKLQTNMYVHILELMALKRHKTLFVKWTWLSFVRKLRTKFIH
jgi:hypothetical protein